MKRIPETAALILIGIVLAQLLDLVLFSSKPERRFLLYSIQRELHDRLPLVDVEEIVQRHKAPFIHEYRKDDSITLRVDTGFTDSAVLSITFTDGHLTSARIRGEDGPHERFEDAPPDIGTK